jgi:hypothetical protein
MGQVNNEASKLNPLNLLVLVLSVYVLLALLIDTIFSVPEEVSKVLDLVDTLRARSADSWSLEWKNQ